MAERSSERTASRKPSDTAFKQQRLKAWQPILTASTALPVFFVVGFVFVPIGIVLLVASDGVQERSIEYTHCNSSQTNKGCDEFFHEVNNSGKTCTCEMSFKLSSDYSGNVFIYYGLSNFYQNHRRYVRSRDDLQLNGQLQQSVNKDCAPFDKNSSGTSTAPCGAIANSLFNDTFELSYMKSPGTKVPVPLTDKNIAWESDRTVKFKNPSGDLKDAFSKYSKPRDWQKPVYELDPSDKNDNGFLNQDFIIWMRTAAFSTFRKLYRKVVLEKDFKDGLPKGTYVVKINYNYPVTRFDGEKRVIISTTSWIGGKNPFLGVAYITVGVLCIVLGICFLIIHIKFGKRGYTTADGLPLQDMSN
ncbi:cell cycle control protein 50A-like isoform X2 [Actinia tenebrosa]|uniref:Cell cycle control protein 50A-like isoform X2 n=1 Tax=Actinia tenebrosa TaxID=6105 RepID=A0A6P8I9N2_ACTTE|nr:cell cycle control protein 50A-like isoform X2 [Actinia tenebrosa]